MFAYLTVENEFLQSNKTQDEIRKFTLEEDLGQRKRTLLLLTKGESIQRRAIYEGLAGFLTELPATWSTVLNILKETTAQQDGEAQAVIARELRKLVLAGFDLEDKQFAELFHFTVGMLEQWNEKSADSWLQLFSALASRKQFAVLEKDAMATLVRLSDPRQIQPLRVVAAKALSLLAEVMKSRIKGLMLDRMRSYCRDQDRQLRLTIVKDVLPRLYHNLPQDLLGMHFNERIFELLYDSDQQVKLAALQFLFGNCELFPAQQKENRITNILIQHLDGGNQQVLMKLSAAIGEIYVKLRQYLEKNPKHMTSFLAALKSMSTSPQQQTRINFLYNLPGLLYYLDIKLWSEVKQNYLKLLVDAESPDVRAMALVVFHQIVQICGIRNFKEHPQLLLQLLQELNRQQQRGRKQDLLRIFVGLFENIDLVVGGIHRHMLQLQEKEENNDQVQIALVAIHNSMMQVMSAAYSLNKHYLVEKLHRKLRNCILYFKSSQLLTEYVPLLLQQLGNMNRITMKEEIQALCDTLYNSSRRVDSEIVLKRLHDNFLKSTCWRRRTTYLRVTRALLQYLSFCRYRQLQLFELSTSLVRDKVLQVRLQCVSYMEHCMKNISMEEQEVLCCHQAMEFWRQDTHFLMVEALQRFRLVVQASADQLQHWKMVRDIRNQQKLRHQETLTEFERPSVQLENSVKISTLITKKALPPKQKKQYGSKYASKLKAKINISLSTNSLGMQNALRGDALLKQKLSEKLSQKRQCSSAANRNEVLDVMIRTKKPSIMEHITQVERIHIRKKPSIDASNYQELRRDILKRTSTDTKRRRNATQKKIE